MYIQNRSKLTVYQLQLSFVDKTHCCLSVT